MDGWHLSTVGVVGVEDPTVNPDIQLVAFMLPIATVAKLRGYAATNDESQHSVVVAALEQYMAARKKD